MNRQEIFTQVATHLLTQKKKSTNGKFCQYRGPNGTSCAVGCLISNEFYDRSMEGETVEDILRSYVLPDYMKDAKNLLCDLQRIHDWDNARTWKKMLTQYASKNHLEMPILK